MKIILLSLISVLFFSCNTSKNVSSNKETTQINQNKVKSVYDFNVKDIDEKDFLLKKLKGKKIMIVNTASKCGLTPQYKSLEELYNKYKDKNFIIIGFPANNFSEQEPGSNKDISEFCMLNYGVSFPMMSKISVAGQDEAPIYKYLKNKNMNGFSDSEVAWNFQKYLINEKGFLEKIISPKTDPLDKEVISWIEGKTN